MWKILIGFLGTFILGFFLGYRKGGNSESCDDLEEDTRCVVFQVQAPEAAGVTLAGDFNNWDPKADELFNLGGGKWGVTLYLKPGRYQYKFVIDGLKWIEDSNSRETEDDGYGGRRSIIYVE
ncbi:MAG: isoamylase early set domain-containing protein [Candidatus Wallbacteria bacterium]|nr:isoamylase early set domain-containing protein [Candidatus Wallbacteria bacterium]